MACHAANREGSRRLPTYGTETRSSLTSYVVTGQEDVVHTPPMRVEPIELADVRSQVLRVGTAYQGDGLDGAEIDIRSALWDEGFAEPEIRRTGVPEEMLVIPTIDLHWTNSGGVIIRLEKAWDVASFAQELHTLDVEDDAVELKFITW